MDLPARPKYDVIDANDAPLQSRLGICTLVYALFSLYPSEMRFSQFIGS